MIDIPFLIRDFFACKCDLQTWINNRYKDPNTRHVPIGDIDHLVTNDGAKFKLSSDALGIGRIPREYDMRDITENDVVLDLGANVGGFAIRAAMKARHVYAVEPLFYPELEENIKLNGLRNKITVMKIGLGTGGSTRLTFIDHSSIVKTYPYQRILEMIPEPVTFLKIDVEGAEWLIDPIYLSGLRRIEFEAHYPPASCYPHNPEVTDYIREHWSVTESDIGTSPAHWIHAYRQPLEART